MDFKITPVLSADELKDKAFNRASKKSKRGEHKTDSKKKTISAKLNTVAHVLEDTLKRYEEEFPTIDMLPTFYREIIDITVGVDELKESLGSINWARRRIKRTLMESARKLTKSEDIEEMERIQREAYGRASSFLDQVDDDLEFLDESRVKLNSLPDIKTDLPTVVVAGYPNVGKSLLVSKISSGKPKVATYPFTTQEVDIGHFDIDRQRCQMIDTPGLLDRPKEDRNQIEMQAVRALESLADMIIFVYDPSETCGYPMDQQKALAEEINQTFSDIDILEIDNKKDLNGWESERLQISALEETNLEELINKIKERLRDEFAIEKVTDEYFIEQAKKER